MSNKQGNIPNKSLLVNIVFNKCLLMLINYKHFFNEGLSNDIGISMESKNNLGLLIYINVTIRPPLLFPPLSCSDQQMNLITARTLIPYVSKWENYAPRNKQSYTTLVMNTCPRLELKLVPGLSPHRFQDLFSVNLHYALSSSFPSTDVQ